jgi:cyclic pyranopterin phosphate synthase
LQSRAAPTACPAEGLAWLPSAPILTDDEVIRLLRVAVERLGVTEVRSPVASRCSVPAWSKIVGRGGRLAPRRTLSLTTNGIGLARTARQLRAVGLDRVNVSLDTLSPERFTELTRRKPPADVLDGLAAADEAGLRPVKINSVLMRGINDDEAVPLLGSPWQRLRAAVHRADAARRRHTWNRAEMVTGEEILAQLRSAFELTPDPAHRGAAPAETWLVDGGPAKVGVIASVSRPFCGAATAPADRRRRDPLVPVQHRGDRPARTDCATAPTTSPRRAWAGAMWAKPPATASTTVRSCSRRARCRRSAADDDPGAVLRRRAGRRGVPEEKVVAPDARRAADRAVVDAHGDRLRAVLAGCSFLVDGLACHDRRPAAPDAVVDVLPPFAGG